MLSLIDLRFTLGILLPAGVLYNVMQRPEDAGIGALLVLVTFAAAEAWVPALARSPAPAGPKPMLAWLLRLFVPMQLVLLAAGLSAARNADWAIVAGLAFAVGLITGAQGITYAHELGHSRQRGDRLLAWVLMTSVNYPQFMVEHYRGHHLRAATWDDPASARRGESLWRFLPRTVLGTLLAAWRIERERGRGWLRSPLAWCTVLNLVFIAVLMATSLKMLAFWLAQSAFAVWLLESVNYIEHYGLQRRNGADGRPEPFGVAHAWNADHVISNSLLVNLMRHSNHHMHAGRPFPELEPLQGPQLPTGYAGCVLLAAVPPLWFAAMEPRIEALS
jgi:alkane 1-monooxygenase